MTDILNLIDATLDQRCACGCGRPLPPDGPSAFYATEDCQALWLLEQRDPERARRLREQAARRQRQAAEAVRQANALFAQIAQQLRPVMEAIGQAMARHAAQIEAIRTAHGIVATPTDPRERALAHVRNRNTGPQTRLRAPRRIDPRTGR